MEIISIYFVILVILSLPVYYNLNQKARVFFLNVLSCGFVASLSLNLFFYILIYTLLNFLIGLFLARVRYKTYLFRFGILINLLQILVLNYADFTINPVIFLFGLDFDASIFSRIIVPIGISYFTLQGIGYLVNVKMEWEKPEKNYFDFLLYMVFFPKFLSGPIERSNTFLPQIKTFQNFDYSDSVKGLRLIVLGFFKKLIIANHLAPFIALSYSNTESIGGFTVLLIILIQPLYLYFDFSGYTDIAIGFAKLYGINLHPNFNRPFLSENITNFWKRFHISLSSWFNDYIFRQLSFKLRKWKHLASIIALLVTWTLFGIWHGAGWNFMLLGVMFSIAIIYEYFTRRLRYKLFSKLPLHIRRWMGRFFTYAFYGIALTFFFSPDLGSTITFFGNLFTSWEMTLTGGINSVLLFGLAVATIFILFEILQNDYAIVYVRLFKYWNDNRVVRIIAYFIAILLIISEVGSNSTFVYQMF